MKVQFLVLSSLLFHIAAVQAADVHPVQMKSMFKCNFGGGPETAKVDIHSVNMEKDAARPDRFFTVMDIKVGTPKETVDGKLIVVEANRIAFFTKLNASSISPTSMVLYELDRDSGKGRKSFISLFFWDAPRREFPRDVLSGQSQLTA